MIAGEKYIGRKETPNVNLIVEITKIGDGFINYKFFNDSINLWQNNSRYEDNFLEHYMPLKHSKDEIEKLINKLEL